MEVFSTDARTIPIVSTVNGRARYAGKGCWSRAARNSSAATAAGPLKPALNATTGWRSGWASTVASWDARVFQPVATPGRLVLKSRGVEIQPEHPLQECEQISSFVSAVVAPLIQGWADLVGRESIARYC